MFVAVLVYAFARVLIRDFNRSVEYRRKYGTKAAKIESKERQRSLQEFDWRANGYKASDKDIYK